MTLEYETKILNINVSEIIDKLRSLGAKQKHPETLMRRWVFDLDSDDPEWIRLRDNGENVSLAYKNKKSSAISGTEEIEVIVDKFEETAQILMNLKFKKNYYQENKRVTFVFNDIEFMIDTWPMIPSYLEIESSSEEKVKQGLKLLHLEDKEAGNLSMTETYRFYGLDLHTFKELKFP
ncbi:MAG TPA: CYTH domain-containing protein [Candidatus Nanoarchaeia archaeon]|nr:CYTH domain-containing protein [Candidatus Nanoarchaeia archaeon]